jgi:hypothetical protein
MDSYVISERASGMFTVAKFSDHDIPDHVATVVLSKRKVSFDYYHPATIKTVNKYIMLVNAFIANNKRPCITYFYENEQVSCHEYGVV